MKFWSGMTNEPVLIDENLILIGSVGSNEPKYMTIADFLSAVRTSIQNETTTRTKIDSDLLKLIQEGGGSGGGSSFGGSTITSAEILDSTATPNGYPVQLTENYTAFNVDHFALLVLASNGDGGTVQIAYFWDGSNKVKVRSGEANNWGDWETIGDLTLYETTENANLKLAKKVDKVTLLSIDLEPSNTNSNASDLYYHDGLIYEAQLVDTGQGDFQIEWSPISSANTGVIYLYNFTNYVWNGTGLVEIGKIPAASEISYSNTTYPTVELALAHLLYVTPSISSFTGGSTNEIGSSVTPILNWAYNKAITEQRINGTVETLANRTKTLAAITADASYALYATDGTNSVNGSQSILFKYYKFWGTGVTPSGADSTAKRSNILAKNPTFQSIASGTFTMQTGTIENNFFVCLPPGLSLISALDTTANAAVTFGTAVDYVMKDAGGTDRTYKMYIVTLGQAFSSNHNWTITVGQ